MPTIINRYGVKSVVDEKRAAFLVEHEGAVIVPDIQQSSVVEPHIAPIAINELPNDEKFSSPVQPKIEPNLPVVEEATIVEKPAKRGRPKKS